MSRPSHYFLIALTLFLAVQLSLAGYYYWRARRLSHTSWEELMAKLTMTNPPALARVALEIIHEEEQTRSLAEEEGSGPSDLWAQIGGLEGLRALEKNSETLIEIAFYLQRWHPEAVVIAEQLRSDARELRWHISRLVGAARTGNLQISFPFYARRAVTTYYLMTRRVLDLYEHGNTAMLLDLQRALQA